MLQETLQQGAQEILRLTNIEKSFSTNKVLIDVNFSLNRGEVRALVGENGAGKSTMIRIIAGASQQDAGTIMLFGKEVNFSSPKESIDAGIAVIYQELDLLPEMTVIENMFLGIEEHNQLRCLDHKKMEERTRQYFEEMQLDIDMHVQVGSLPIATQQVVAIAKAAVHSASVLIMDEPSSSLTNKELAVLFKQIRRLKEKKVSVIYISHRLEEIFQVCDSVTVLRDGKLIKTADVKDVTHDEIIEWMIGKQITQERINNRMFHSDDVILEAHNICYKDILNNVSFQVKTGELFGILGLLGSGFIEIGKVLYGVYKPSAGYLSIRGGKANMLNSPSDALSNSIAYVPDQRRVQGLFMELDVLTNATITSVRRFLTGRLKLLNKKAMNKNFRQYKENMDIKITDYTQIVRYLSGGNQQKVIIARTFLSNTDIIIMSCPTKGIDVGSKYDIYRILLECVQQGKTVIVISQEIPELVQICDRILMLKKGEVYHEYQGEEISGSLIYRDLLRQ